MTRELHLFAGVGGGILGGMLLGHRPVGAVELDPFCRQVLEQRQGDGVLPPFPIHDDIRTFDARPWRRRVDAVCGGFPCQPWSSAGKRLGAADPRHLWPEMARVVDECRPRWVFAENVSLAAFEEPWRDLRRLGYRVPPALRLAAADVGAPHLRRRWWLLAGLPDADGKGERSEPKHAEVASASAVDVSDADGSRLAERQGQRRDHGAERAPAVGGRWWDAEPRVGRVAHGVSARVDRLCALGNAQVPLVAAAAWQALMAEHFGGGAP